jgi:hypothetical protein
VVEFYANFTEPWGGGAPLKPGDGGYRTVSLRDPNGDDARIGAGAAPVVQLDGNPDLSDVIPNPAPAANPVLQPLAAAGYPPRLKFLYDSLWLAADTGRPSRTYRIMSVDDTAKTVTLDARPTCAGDRSKWRLNRRPIIVVVDPLGPRVRRLAGPPVRDLTYSGVNATVRPDPADPTRTIVRLDGTQPLDRLNAAFDTIHLPADTSTSPSRPGPVYRIFAVNAVTRDVTIVGHPTLDGGRSAWEIPAGLSGVPPTLDYDLGPQWAGAGADPMRLTRGYDHYDGAYFVVYRDKVEGTQIWRWTTYTSRDHGLWSEPAPTWKEELSSLRGNARYYYSSYRSNDNPPHGPFKNYTFAVIDATPSRTGLLPAPPHGILGGGPDQVAEARHYYGSPSPPGSPQADPQGLDLRVLRDPNGKREIRFHRGSRSQRVGTGSAGCIVSPNYVTGRTDMLRLFERAYEEYYGPGTFDPEVRKATNATTYPASETLWTPGVGLDLTAANYDDKVVGAFWLIRPDERPLSP